MNSIASWSQLIGLHEAQVLKVLLNEYIHSQKIMDVESILDVAKLRNVDIDLNTPCEIGPWGHASPFHMVIVFCPRLIFPFISSGACAGRVDSHGCNALHVAAKYGVGESVVKLALIAPNTVVSKNHSSLTPAQLAEIYSHSILGAYLRKLECRVTSRIDAAEALVSLQFHQIA